MILPARALSYPAQRCAGDADDGGDVRMSRRARANRPLRPGHARRVALIGSTGGG